MSESVESAADELPVAFSTFASELRPRAIRNPLNGAPIGLTAGQPDEIWLKYLQKMHGNEKHTMTEWAALIDGYRNQPAY